MTEPADEDVHAEGGVEVGHGHSRRGPSPIGGRSPALEETASDSDRDRTQPKEEMSRFAKSTLCAAVLAASLAGCGSAEQPAPDGAPPSADRPRESFQTEGNRSPESFEQASAKTSRTSGADDYTYVHAHLARIDYMNCTHWDWAVVATGRCPGYFLDGSAPFSGGHGESRWEKFGGREGSVPRPARSIPAVADAGIKITQATDSGQQIECYISDRGSADCFTDPSQRGNPAGQQGGPLRLDASFPSHGDNYVFVRGYCRKGDKLCTPH